jgi:hypothetical protein
MGHCEKECFKKKKDEASGETAAVAASGNGNEAADMMCLGFEILIEKAYEEVPSGRVFKFGWVLLVL